MKTLGKMSLLQIVFLIAASSGVLVAQAPTRAGSSPKPTPAASPQKSTTPVQTLDDLRSKIRNRMLSPENQRGRVGIKVTSLISGKVIFENDAEKYFIPASNMKNFTVAAALEKLGPDFRFVTSVYAAAKPDADGIINGDLCIWGRGDVSISTAFNNGDHYKGIDNLVDKIAAAGVKRIEGDLIGDESYFKGFAIPYTWEWDDLQWYDGAEVSALPVNNNAVDLNIKPGTSSGGQCLVTVLPQTPLMPIVNTCRTVSMGQPRTLKVFKPLGRNSLEISGEMPLGDKGFSGYVAFTHPAELFVALLKERMQKKGIIVMGDARTVSGSTNSWPVEVAKLQSPPLSLIAAQTMKQSQNMFSETILWQLDLCCDQSLLTDDSLRPGTNVVREWMKQISIPRDAVIQYDGSGMSRHNQVTPSSVVTLYTYMAKQSKNAQVWRDSLTVGGVDGTLSRRFTGTAAAGNMRGKTGTLDQVSALSGYLTTAGGEQLVISIIVNGVAETRARTALIDDVVVQLANFNGKIE